MPGEDQGPRPEGRTYLTEQGERLQRIHDYLREIDDYLRSDEEGSQGWHRELDDPPGRTQREAQRIPHLACGVLGAVVGRPRRCLHTGESRRRQRPKSLTNA
jgi:hypothetical protein